MTLFLFSIIILLLSFPRTVSHFGFLPLFHALHEIVHLTPTISTYQASVRSNSISRSRIQAKSPIVHFYHYVSHTFVCRPDQTCPLRSPRFITNRLPFFPLAVFRTQLRLSRSTYAMKSTIPFFLGGLARLAAVTRAHTIFTTLYVDDVSQGDGTCVRMSRTPENCTSPVSSITSDDMACGKFKTGRE